MRKWSILILFLLTLLTLYAEFGFPVDAEHGHWWNKIPGFFILFGFLGCILLILAARALGKYWLIRNENYYDDK